MDKFMEIFKSYLDLLIKFLSEILGKDFTVLLPE